MKRAVLAACVLMLLLAALSPVSAQSKPNFTGKWTLVWDPSVKPTALGELGEKPTVTHDAKTITVVTMQPAGELRSVYNLDGSESKNPITFGELSLDRVSTVKWDGARLIIQSKLNVAGQIIETTQTWSLSTAGELVVDAVASVQGKQITTKRTYRKN